MIEKPQNEYEHETTLFTEQEFWTRFQNFHLIFVLFNNPDYQPEITAFLTQNYPELSSQLVEKMEGVSRPTDIDTELIPLLYDAYLKLRQEGGFSNKKLGLTYWGD